MYKKKKISHSEIKQYLANKETFDLGIKLLSTEFEVELITDFVNFSTKLKENRYDRLIPPGFYVECRPPEKPWSVPKHCLVFNNYKKFRKFRSHGFLNTFVFTSHLRYNHFIMGDEIPENEIKDVLLKYAYKNRDKFYFLVEKVNGILHRFSLMRVIKENTLCQKYEELSKRHFIFNAITE